MTSWPLSAVGELLGEQPLRFSSPSDELGAAESPHQRVTVATHLEAELGLLPAVTKAEFKVDQPARNSRASASLLINVRLPHIPERLPRPASGYRCPPLRRTVAH